MEKCIIHHSCRFCIWNEECEYKQFCQFYDDGRDKINLSDKELEMEIEFEKSEYKIIYDEYIKEFC